MQDDDKPFYPDIEIGVNPHADAERLYDDFCIELDPFRDRAFLRRLGELEPGRWELLETLCQDLDELPDHAQGIIDIYPGRFALCRVSWFGSRSDENQPDSVILAGDNVSLYLNAMQMNVSKRYESSDGG